MADKSPSSPSTRPLRRLVTVTGPDRPGLVAAVSRVLAEEGADLEDVSMTRLSGNFTTMILARGGAEEALNRRLQAEVAKPFSLHVHLEPAVEHAVREPDADAFIAASGPNRIGIVAAISDVLAKHQVNILEMATRLLERTQVPVYDVRIEAVVPPAAWSALEGDLRRISSELGIDVRIERIEAAEL